MRTMRWALWASLSALIAGMASAQTPAPSPSTPRPEWENPLIDRIGAEPMHTSFAGFETRAGALSGDVAKSRYHL